MKLLVCGSRDWVNYTEVRRRIEKLNPDLVIEGGAKGADSHARIAAHGFGVPVMTFHADWSNLGRAAGSVRNQWMLDHGKPDMVLAFPLEGSKGTWDMVRRAKKAGLPVEIVEISVTKSTANPSNVGVEE